MHHHLLSSKLPRFARRLTMVVGSLLAAVALAQSTTGAPVPSLIAVNDCRSGDCARQMLSMRQLETRQQSAVSAALQHMPGSITTGSKPSTSCTWHEHGGGQWTLVCLSITAEGSCACVITPSGGSCIGSNPYCPARI